MLDLGSVKKWRFCFFRKTRKLIILGRVCPKMGPKWSKMPKIEGFLHFFENRILDFSNFCMNASLRECKKVTLFFSGKLENWTFWAVSVQNLSQNGQKCPKSKVLRFFGLSTESMDLWIHLRTFVRTFVPIFLKIHASEFSDFWSDAHRAIWTIKYCLVSLSLCLSPKFF